MADYDGSTYLNFADTDSLAIRVLKNTNNIIYNGTNYLTKTDASSTYATASALTAFQTSVASTYLTIASASSTYLTIANATATYQHKKVTKTITYSGTVVVDSTIGDGANASMDLTAITINNFLKQLFIDLPNEVKVNVNSVDCYLHKSSNSYVFNNVDFQDDANYQLVIEKVLLLSSSIVSSLFSLTTSVTPISPNNVTFNNGLLGAAGTKSITISYEI
jgi:hypothetical protein